MKISLFTKSYTIKALSFVALIVLVAGAPVEANASFFNSLVATVVGSDAQAIGNTGTLPSDVTPSTDNASADNSGFGTDDFSSDPSNSQNMQLLESSVNPDMKNASAQEPNATISSDGGVLVPNGSLNVAGGVGLESVSNGQESTYIVKEGDTLSEIAQQFDISTNTIKWANNISGNTIRVGEKLTILPVTGVKHIVKSGDTLSGIAAKYDASLDDIMIFNDIKSGDVLKQGQVIYVPNGVPGGSSSKSSSKSSSSSSSRSSSSSSSSSIADYYIKPVKGPITSPYGPRRGGFHYGVDIGARYAPFVAAASGTVIETVTYCREGHTSCGGRYGNFIVIQHPNGQRTRYAHLSKVYVHVGQKVSQGETIGVTGNTGHTTGPHLHFQIEKANGSTIRPVF